MLAAVHNIRDIHADFLLLGRQSPGNYTVTLVTVLSLERFDRLFQILHHWEGTSVFLIIVTLFVTSIPYVMISFLN